MFGRLEEYDFGHWCYCYQRYFAYFASSPREEESSFLRLLEQVEDCIRFGTAQVADTTLAGRETTAFREEGKKRRSRYSRAHKAMSLRGTLVR